MDDKIKAWIREGERLMSEFTAVLVDGFSDCAALVKADAAMRAHLRTTPEGFVLVPTKLSRAMEAVLENEKGAYQTGDDLYADLIAASQESGT